MSDLLNRIAAAQREAGERVVMDDLKAKGLGVETMDDYDRAHPDDPRDDAERLEDWALAIARRHAKAKPQSYYAEPFQPHEWVLDAILEALQTRRGVSR